MSFKEQADLLTQLQPTEEDVRKMLCAGVHMGTRNLVSAMKDYVYRRQQDGVYVINLERTWQKLVLAARIIVAVENPQDVVVLSGREQGQRPALKFATYTGCKALPGRFTPGTFTNQIQKQFVEPRLLIITDPLEDSQALREAAYVNIPVIAFCSTDCNLDFVDCCIPASNKGKLQLGLLYWLLYREVKRLRGECSRNEAWEEPVDLFFHKTQEELDQIMRPKEKEEEEAVAGDDYAGVGGGDQWETAVDENDGWDAAADTGLGGGDAGTFDAGTATAAVETTGGIVTGAATTYDAAAYEAAPVDAWGAADDSGAYVDPNAAYEPAFDATNVDAHDATPW